MTGDFNDIEFLQHMYTKNTNKYMLQCVE